jgi:hypothetical protein
MGHPSPQQCRERYYQYLSLALNNSPITPEEGVLIHKWQEEIGRQWPEIARRLGNRGSLAIQFWWYATFNSPKDQMNQQRKNLRKPGRKKVNHSPAVTKRCWQVESTGNGRFHFQSKGQEPETKRKTGLSLTDLQSAKLRVHALRTPPTRRLSTTEHG